MRSQEKMHQSLQRMLEKELLKRFLDSIQVEVETNEQGKINVKVCIPPISKYQIEKLVYDIFRQFFVNDIKSFINNIEITQLLN